MDSDIRKIDEEEIKNLEKEIRVLKNKIKDLLNE
jgi:hypothetical protein